MERRYKVYYYSYWGKEFAPKKLYTEAEAFAVQNELREDGYGVKITKVEAGKEKILSQLPANNCINQKR